MFGNGHGHSHGPPGNSTPCNHSHGDSDQGNMMQKALLQILAKNNGQLPSFPPNTPQHMKDMALKFFEKNKALIENQAIPLGCSSDSNSDVNCNPLLMATSSSQSNSSEPTLTKEQEDAKVQVAIDTKDYATLDIVKATQYGIMERCKELVESGAVDVNQPDVENVYLLHWAAINNRIELSKYYLEKGAQVDVIGGTLESTPLHWAARSGHISMVILLLNAGADPLLCDNEGYSTLHLASMFGHSSIVAYLLAKGVDADLQDRLQATPLMYASQRIHNRDPAQLLITFNARLNAQDKNGNTPLHYCVQFNNATVMRILLDKGASLEVKNSKGLTPFELAIERKKQNTVFMLSAFINDNKSSVPSICRPLATNKDIRRLATKIFPFFVLLYLASIFQSSINIFIKIVLLLGIYAIYTGFSYLFFDKFLSKYMPIATTFSFIFWLYATWFVYLRPLVFNIFSLYGLAFLVCTYFSWYNLYKAWRTNPGILNNKRDEISKCILRYIEKNEFSLDQFCTSCVVRKPIRSKHCSECDHCVSKFDHHCPWVDNCIGQFNLKYFIGFVTWTPACLAFYMNDTINYLITYCISHNETSSIQALWYFIAHTPWITFFACIGAFNLFWISMLGICHLYQALYLGITTNERMNMHRYAHFKDKNGRFYNPFNFGLFANVADAFDLKWEFLRPHRIDWIREYDMDELMESNRIKRPKCVSTSQKPIDKFKLEALSLVTVDEIMLKKLANVIQIAQRMNEVNTDTVSPLIHLDHVGFCPTREDTQAKKDHESLMKLSKNIYEDYYKV